MKRLTIDVDPELHKRIKRDCLLAGKLIAEEVRQLLEERWPAEQAG